MIKKSTAPRLSLALQEFRAINCEFSELLDSISRKIASIARPDEKLLGAMRFEEGRPQDPRNYEPDAIERLNGNIETFRSFVSRLRMVDAHLNTIYE